jgi:hypothetical protein
MFIGCRVGVRVLVGVAVGIRVVVGVGVTVGSGVGLESITVALGGATARSCGSIIGLLHAPAARARIKLKVKEKSFRLSWILNR